MKIIFHILEGNLFVSRTNTLPDIEYVFHCWDGSLRTTGVLFEYPSSYTTDHLPTWVSH